MLHLGLTKATEQASHDSLHRPHHPHQGGQQMSPPVATISPCRVNAMRLPLATTQHCHTDERASCRETEDKRNHSVRRPSSFCSSLPNSHRFHTKRNSCRTVESSLAAYARSSPREDGPEEKNFAMLDKPATNDEIEILRWNINSGPFEPPQQHNIVTNAQKKPSRANTNMM